MAIQPQQQIKNPGLAAILSFLLAGLRQIYNGQIGKGILIMVVQFINGLLMMVIIGFITAPIVAIWAIYDAYKTAQRINEQATQQNTKTCPQCGSHVAKMARLCPYCGYQFMPAASPAAFAAPSSPHQAATDIIPEYTQPAPVPATLPPPSQPQKAAYSNNTLGSLVVTTGDLIGQSFAIDKDNVLIGRASDCDIRIKDPTISRRHARLRLAQGQWFIQDQNSASGLYVNGSRVSATRLQAGDNIRMGQTDLRFQPH